MGGLWKMILGAGGGPLRLAKWSVALSVIASSGAGASSACLQVSLGDSKAAFMQALAPRLAAVGVISIVRAGSPAGGVERYRLIGAPRVSLLVREENDVLVEIGASTLTLADQGDSEIQLEIAAFALARYSYQLEGAVLQKLITSAAKHPGAGGWTESFGPASASFTRSGDGLTVKVGKAICN
jgi:hypothetical protein